jgi:16S rRNA (guanine527-N7)-methyltransferase
MLTQHLFDCLAVIEPLRRVAGAGRLLDVGSGGGLPGVVIALLCPGWQVVCVDTVGKKAAFIQQAAVELRLPNLRAQHARVESLALPPFDVITSRAFASLQDFVRLTRTSLAPGGVWMAMKGKRPDDELAGLPADIDVFHVEQLTVPDLAAERCIVWMRPRTPATKES